MSAQQTKQLYFGDNLHVLREHIADESVDLIYLDPPFNSKRDYNLLFKTPKGHESDAQITAFEDTWHWGQQAADEFMEIMKSGNTDVAELMQALRAFLKENDMMAYLTMMANRLLELHRVLKPTGSLYLHCDPAASHYLKLVLDGVFGQSNFRIEIIWRRTNSHNSTTTQYGPIHDVIFFYSKTESFEFHPGARPYSNAYIKDRFKYDDIRGRYQTNYLTGPGTRKGDSGKLWRGFDPTSAGRHWAIPKSLRPYLPKEGAGMSSQEQLEALYAQELIVFPKKEGGQPMYKQYVGGGVAYQDIWAYQPNTSGVLYQTDEYIDEDVKYLEDEDEKLGYPTQKPLGLLARIISSSSNENDVVLDPFCGCGTALDAAEKLKRNWIGIDITHLSIALIEKRLTERHPHLRNAAKLTSAEAKALSAKQPEQLFEVHGVPQDFEAAKDLAERDKYQFQFWACTLVNAQPYKGGKKGADGGVDGVIFPEVGKNKTEKIIVSVKGGGNVTLTMLKDLIATVASEKAAVGLFITLTPPTKPMMAEAAAAGHYESPLHGDYPKIQILTVEGLLNGTERARYPDMSQGGQTMKKAKADKKNKAKDQQGLFGE